MIFDVKSPIQLKSVKVKTDIAGVRQIELKDKNGILLDAKQLMIDTGTTRISLNFFIPIGKDYQLTTNTDVNNANLGFAAPRLWRENINVKFPYEIDKTISIKSSDKGWLYFYYFLDWEIQQEPFYCESKRKKISAIVDSIDATVKPIIQNINVFPNPASEYVQLSTKIPFNTIRIISKEGKIISTPKIHDVNPFIDIHDLSPGKYYLSIFHNNKWYYFPFVKI